MLTIQSVSSEEWEYYDEEEEEEQKEEGDEMMPGAAAARPSTCRKQGKSIGVQLIDKDGEDSSDASDLEKEM